MRWKANQSSLYGGGLRVAKGPHKHLGQAKTTPGDKKRLHKLILWSSPYQKVLGSLFYFLPAP